MVADQDGGVSSLGRDAAARRVGKGRWLDDIATLPAAGIGDNRLAERMFGAQFGCSRCIEKFISGRAGNRCDLLHLRATEGQRTRLVEYHRVDMAQRLQMHATLDDCAKPG